MAECDDFVYTDAILSRKWSYQEVHHLLTSQLAVLPGQLELSLCSCHGDTHVMHCLL